MGNKSSVREETRDIHEKDEQGWGVSMVRKWLRRAKQQLRKMAKHFSKQNSPKNPQHQDSQGVYEDEDQR